MNVVENLLVTLMEECSEVAKAASKILRAGPESVPPGRSTTNLQELKAELDDLQGVLYELRANGLDVAVRNPQAVVRKREKLRHYIGVSRQLGFVQGPLAAGELEACQFLAGAPEVECAATQPGPAKPFIGASRLPNLAEECRHPAQLHSAKDFTEQCKPTVMAEEPHHPYCPLCAGASRASRRDGMLVYKCGDKKCRGAERWLEPEQYDQLG